MTISVIFDVINKATKPLQDIDKNVKGINSTLSRMQTNMTRMNQTTELLGRMSSSAEQLSKPFIDFESTMADFSALTGVAGKELKQLGEYSRQVGIDSGLGATAAVGAFKLLASQIDVSKVGVEGLKTLHQETITLAQASGISMADAANSMAGTINQFGLAATDANRVINVLAAGSKYGAAEIPELAQSFKVVGAAANAAGLTIEDTAGALEVLSKNNLKGAEAGTALRNIMLKMQTALGVDFEKTSMSQALDALKPKLKDTTYLSKVFGMENIAAAQFLIANSDAVDEMTARVTGTSVAQEQATINTDTWSQKLKIQAAQINDWGISIGESGKGILNIIQVGGQFGAMFTAFTPLVNGGVSVLKSVVSVTGGVVKGISTTTRVFKALNAAAAVGNMSRYYAILSKFPAVSRLIAVGINLQKLATGGFMPLMKGMIASTWAWTAALLANPITWVVVGIAALVAAIVICWNKFAEFRAGALTTWDVIKGFGVAIFDYMVAPFKVAYDVLKGLIEGIMLMAQGEWKAGFKAMGNGVMDGLTAGVESIKSSFDGFRETTMGIEGSYTSHLTDERAKDAAKKSEKGKSNNDAIVIVPASSYKRVEPAYSNMSAPGSTTQMNYSPQITISGDMSEKSKTDLMGLLQDNASYIAGLIKEQNRKEDRLNYGIS